MSSSAPTEVVWQQKKALEAALSVMIQSGDCSCFDYIQETFESVGLSFGRFNKKLYPYAIQKDKTALVSNHPLRIKTRTLNALLRKNEEEQGSSSPPSRSPSGSPPPPPPPPQKEPGNVLHPSKKRKNGISDSSDEDDNGDEDEQQAKSRASGSSTPDKSNGPQLKDKQQQKEEEASAFAEVKAIVPARNHLCINELEYAKQYPEIFTHGTANRIQEIFKGFNAVINQKQSDFQLPCLPDDLTSLDDALPFIEHSESTAATKEYISFVHNIDCLSLHYINELGKKLDDDSILTLPATLEKKEALRKKIVHGERMVQAISKYGFICTVIPVFNNSSLCRISEVDMKNILSLCEKVSFEKLLKESKLFIVAQPTPFAFIQKLVNSLNNAQSPQLLLDLFRTPPNADQLAIQFQE